MEIMKQQPRRVDSRKSRIVAADVKRLTLKKTNGTEPPYLGCYGFLNRPWQPRLGIPNGGGLPVARRCSSNLGES